jgi:purine-binding chemotaxis protein CheW
MSGAAPAEEKRQERQFLTFRLGQRLYALPAGDIAEVIRLPSVARVPQAPRGLLGLANLRGTVIPVASGHGLLGQADAPVTAQARAIVMQGEAPVALAVDAVAELRKVEAVESAGLALLPGEQVQGAFADGGTAVKILDLKPLLAAAFVPRPRQERAARRGAAEALAPAQALRQTRLVTFAVAGQDYALPLASVQEVVAMPALPTIVPHAENIVLGVAAFRDTLLPLLSLRGLLGFAQGELQGSEKVVVVRTEGALVGLVADRMSAILAADDDRLEEVPEILAARMGGESRVRAIYRGQEGRKLVSVLDTGQLFGEEVMRKLETARGAEEAAPAAGETGTPVQFVVFRLGAEEFALPIAAVDEVVRLPGQIARLPKAPKFLEGVVNLRGEVLPVVDQRRRFGMPECAAPAGRRLVVVRTARHRAGLIVDSVSQALRTTLEEMAPAPALSGESQALVQGVINLEQQDRIIMALDPAELLTRAEQALLDKFDREQGAGKTPQ